MSYIGREPSKGNFAKMDDISSQFDGIETEFEITADSISVQVPSPRQCLISIDGVIQEAEIDFSIGSTTTSIVFLSGAPTNGSAFWGITLSGMLYAAGVSDGTITTTKLQNDAVTNTKIADDAIDEDNLIDGAVTNVKLSSDSVSNPKIVDNAVTVQKIQDNAVSFDKILSTDIANQAEAEAGTESEKLMTPLTTKQSIQANTFTSSDHTLTLTNMVTESHGLSSVPTKATITLICTSAEHNYTVGQTIPDVSLICDSVGDYAPAISASFDSSNMYLTTGAYFRFINRTTGAVVLLTPASWDARVYAQV